MNELNLKMNLPLDDNLKSIKIGGETAPIELSKDTVRIRKLDVTSATGSFVLDEDSLVSDSATQIATQQSIKAYVDAQSDGWHGSTTRVKILHSDFIADDGGRPVMIDDTGSDRWLESHGTSKMNAAVPIPTGFTATHINIYGSATSAITVYEADINSKTVTSKGTGNIGTEIDITDVDSDTTNYILVQLAQANGEEVYGGYMTIATI